jgi:hypothetical protein
MTEEIEKLDPSLQRLVASELAHLALNDDAAQRIRTRLLQSGALTVAGTALISSKAGLGGLGGLVSWLGTKNALFALGATACIFGAAVLTVQRHFSVPVAAPGSVVEQPTRATASVVVSPQVTEVPPVEPSREPVRAQEEQSPTAREVPQRARVGLAAAPPPKASASGISLPAITAADKAAEPAPAATVTASLLGPESQALLRVREQMRNGRAAAAREALQEYDGAFPRAHLGEERDALEVRVLLLERRTVEAQARAGVFLQRYPQSVFSDKMRSLTAKHN